jgi:hypothetical protein
VFLCREEATGAEVAVKVLRLTVDDESPRLAAHSELLSAGAAARHPCAVPVQDAGFTPGHQPYVVARFCPGGSAQSAVAARGPFAVEDVVVIGLRLALALHSAHRRGVLHLDVRPANILFDGGGDALLADHGIARVLQRSAPRLGAVFDPMYAARELFGWEKPGPAADVYGLGATLYALLNGGPAYAEAGRAGWSALYQEVLRGQLPPPVRAGVPEQLLALVGRMMSANPEGRPPLTEVHRVLRLLLPASAASRVPALEPEPAPVVPLPGWDPADDAAPEEQAALEQAGPTAQGEARRNARRRLIAAGTALVVFAATATAVTVLLHDRGRSGKPSASPTAPATTTAARQVPKDQLPDLVPRDVAVTKADGGVQVAWRLPKKAAGISGYIVRAVLPGGKELPVKQPLGAELAVVFPAGSVPGGTCFTVTSVLFVNGSPELASAPEFCGTGAS